jgi:hypothetical protein
VCALFKTPAAVSDWSEAGGSGFSIVFILLTLNLILMSLWGVLSISGEHALDFSSKLDVDEIVSGLSTSIVI